MSKIRPPYEMPAPPPILDEAVAEKDTAFAVWMYYVNDEGRARWKCSACGKVCKHNPHYKNFCSNCGRPMKMEA